MQTKFQTPFYFYLLAILSCSIANVSFANNDNTKNALAKAQYMLRQISSEKTQLETELAKVKKEKEQLQKDLDNAKKDHQKTVSSINSQQLQLTSAATEKNNLIKDIEEEKEKLEALTNESSRLLEKLDAQKNNFQTCYINNKKLYEINQEILGQYQEKGFWDALAQKEPLTTIGRVKVENLIQDYQYKMDDLEIKLVKESNTETH
jgi:septal ring factor EnvC (AmiA/AmiB activator)